MKERKIIQVSTSMGQENDCYTVAICDDGTVWGSFNGRPWQEYPLIPQSSDYYALMKTREEGDSEKD